jgi:hypothetical protein
MLARLDVAAQRFLTYQLPRPNSQPFGLVMDPGMRFALPVGTLLGWCVRSGKEQCCSSSVLRQPGGRAVLAPERSPTVREKPYQVIGVSRKIEAGRESPEKQEARSALRDATRCGSHRQLLLNVPYVVPTRGEEPMASVGKIPSSLPHWELQQGQHGIGAA